MSNQIEKFSLLSTLTTNDSRKDVWYIDSGASRHMPPNKKLSIELEESSSNDSVFLGDDRSYELKGIGTSPIQMPSGGIAVIKNVLYVSSLTKNLFLVSVVADQKMKVGFTEGSCTVLDCKMEDQG